MLPNHAKRKTALDSCTLSETNNLVTDNPAQSESILLMFIDLELLLHNDHDIYSSNY